MMSDEELEAETPEQRRERYRSIVFGSIGNGKPSHLKRTPYRPMQQPPQVPLTHEREGGFRVPVLDENLNPMTKFAFNQDKANNLKKLKADPKGLNL